MHSPTDMTPSSVHGHLTNEASRPRNFAAKEIQSLLAQPHMQAHTSSSARPFLRRLPRPPRLLRTAFVGGG